MKWLWLAVACSVFVTPTLTAAQAVYEYTYQYNTPDLIENHFIVLDTTGAQPRGWYYGTSDEFDTAREGYPPGFFVAPMSALTLTDASISFSLSRPDRFFASPVPIEYRDAAEVPPGRLEEWSMPLTTSSRAYLGARRGDEIELDVAGPPRVFRRRSE